MIELVAIEPLQPAALEDLAARLGRALRADCRIRPASLDASFAFDARRSQYYATVILQALAGLHHGGRLLAVTDDDLFVPVLTFVFGEAQLGGNCAVVSRHRLREEVYGLPANQALLDERLLKEAMHELGHTFGLRHCDDWRCVMTSSHSVEWLDVKSADFCSACRELVFAAV